MKIPFMDRMPDEHPPPRSRNGLTRWRTYVRQLKTDIFALYLAYRHPQVPWYAQLVVAGVVAYAFSPIDLIPDFIPILGYLDDLLLLPAGIMLALRLIPPEVLAECRHTAQERMQAERPTSWIAASVIIVIWLTLTAFIAMLLLRRG